MPMLADGEPPPAPVTPIRPSAVAELFWATFNAQRDPMHVPVATTPGLDAMKPRLAAFWNDGDRSFPELLVLAERAGELFATDLDRFFERLEKAAEKPGEPPLTSETPADRRRILARLARLKAQPALRRSYRLLMSEAWEQAKGLWESEGLAAAEAGAVAWQQVLSRGGTIRDILRGPLLKEHEFLGNLVAEAAGEGRLALAPGFYAGLYLVVDLDSCMFASMGAREMGAGMLRAMSEDLAKRVKALSDPTRLAILAHLATRGAGVTELARTFGVSQPTMSAHVAVLRDADLLRPVKVGGRTTYATDRERAEKLLKAVGDLVTGC